MNPQTTQSIVDALSLGRPQEAEQLCRRHPGLQTHDENVLLLLALSLQMQHRMPDALAVYAQLTQWFPQSSVHWCNYATALLETGAQEAAAEAYATAIRQDAHYAAPRILLGLLQIRRKDYLLARETLLDAVDLDRNLPTARIHAARACSHCQDFHGAEDLLKPWRTWLPLRDDDLQLELARLLQLMGQVPATRELLEDLVARNPARLDASLLLGNVYERLNLLAESEAVARSIETLPGPIDPACANELDHLSAALARRRGDAGGAQALLERCGPRNADDYTHYFELADVCDKLGDMHGAMQALAMAHRLQVREFQIAAPEHFYPDALALPAEVPQASAESARQWPATIAPDARDSPVFIVGFPRSGTTLLEQMLDAHPGLQSMDENPFFNRLADRMKCHDEGIMDKLELLQQSDCDELRKQYLVMVSEKIPRRWDAQLVDKNPLNMLWLPLMHRLFPKAKFILAVRHPCDVILSCYMQNFRSSILGAACESLDRLAAAYVQAMEYWLQGVELFKPDLLVSRYEELVADPLAHAARIARFLDLDDAEPMLRFDRHARGKGYIATPSYDQVIEPVNRKGMNRWLRYRREFEPVLPVVEPMLRHWSYPLE